MAINIVFADLTDAQKLAVADLVQKREALEDQLAKIQTIRANREAEWNGKENDLRTEINKLTIAIRAIRSAIIS